MNFKAHLLTSAAVGVAIPLTWKAVGINLSELEIAYMVTATILGGNFADLDHQSIPSKFYALLSVMASIYFFWIKQPVLILFFALPFLVVKMSRHRGFTHSYFIPAGLLILSILFPTYRNILACFATGCIVHLLLDKIWFWHKKSWIR